MIGSSRPRRRLSSSTSRTILLRRTTRRRQAACFSDRGSRFSTAMRKSVWLSCSRSLIGDQVRHESLERAFLLGGVGDARFRSCGRAAARRWPPFRAARRRRAARSRCANSRRRKRVRVTSICTAEAISSARDEHRDLAHLHEVHADGVVDVRFGAAVFRQHDRLPGRRRARLRGSSGSSGSRLSPGRKSCSSSIT